MPPIAGAASMGPTAMDALAYGAQGGPQPPGSPQGAGIQGGDQLQQKTMAAIALIRQHTTGVQQLARLIPDSDQFIAQLQNIYRQLLGMASRGAAIQNQSADNLPM